MEIERLREEMVELAMEKGCLNSIVLEKSQKLDKLMINRIETKN